MLAAHINVLAGWLGISGTLLNKSNPFFGFTNSIIAALLLRPIPATGGLNFSATALLRPHNDPDIFPVYVGCVGATSPCSCSEVAVSISQAYLYGASYGCSLGSVRPCKPALERLKASTGDARPNISDRLRTTIALVKGMVVLLLEYIPSLFLCGFLVRNYNRANQQNSDDDALQAAHYALHILVHLYWGAEHTTEYVRTVGVSFLFWGRWEQTIPGKSHCEETCEALFARLVEKLRLNPSSLSLDDCFDLFSRTPTTRTDLKDLHASHLQNDTSKLIRRNLNTIVCQHSDGQLVSAVLLKSKVKNVNVMDDWTKVPQFPISLYHDMSMDHFQALWQRTLQSLVNSVALSQDYMDALQQHIPHRSLAQEVDHNAACDTILSQRPPHCYVGRTLAMPQAFRHEGAPVDAPTRDRAPPPPPAHNLDDLPDELVGIPEVYEGGDATSNVEAPPVAAVVSSDPSVLFVLVLEGGADVLSVDDE